MAAPTNITIGTATDLGALPVSLTQRVDDAGTTYTTWYSYTATSSDTTTDQFVRGCWFFGDLAVYEPSVTMWIGPIGAPTNPFNDTFDSVFNKPFQFPATAGVTYYFEVVPNGGNPSPASLTISIEQCPNTAISRGTIIIPEFNPDLNFAALIGHTTGDIFGYRSLPACDFGDILPGGIMALIAATTTPPHVKLYNSQADFLPVADLTGVSTHLTFQQIRGDGHATFFVGDSTTGVAATIKTVSSTGVVGATTWTLPANSKSLRGMAANVAHTILYYGSLNAGSNVYRYDLVNSMALADLVAPIANFAIQKDLLCCEDGTVIVPYRDAVGTADQIIHYSAAGATLNTYALGGTFRLDRINFDVDRAFFLVWSLSADTGKKQRITVADGTITETITFPLFTDGIDSASPSADPPRFGVSNSCPIMALDTAARLIFPTRRLRQGLLPSSENNYRMFMSKLELLMETGLALTPDAWVSTANSPQGANPQIMMRISTDGGKTWHPEQWRSAGLRGQYEVRPRWLKPVRAYRNAVYQIVVSDPVPWRLISLIGDWDEGTS